jgi:hypothetical protein
MPTASAVAMAIARNPLATHLAALTVSSVLDVSAARSWTRPDITAPARYTSAGAGMIQ